MPILQKGVIAGPSLKKRAATYLIPFALAGKVQP